MGVLLRRERAFLDAASRESGGGGSRLPYCATMTKHEKTALTVCGMPHCANNFSTSMSLLQTLRRAAPLPARICANCLRYGSTASVSAHDNGKQQVIFSGIQPTGVPHLGNYLGALRQWVKLQNGASPDTTLLFSIVDLHAITIKQDPRELATWRKEMLASLLAVGLDPRKSIIFAQSSVKQHAELMWILSCGASMGYLGRMTQWKVCKAWFTIVEAGVLILFRASCLCQRMLRLSSPQLIRMLSNLVSFPTRFSKPPTSFYTTPRMSPLVKTKRSISSSRVI
jgi:hypothetical protein